MARAPRSPVKRKKEEERQQLHQQQRSRHTPAPPSTTRATVHLKKEELQRVDELRVNIAARKGQSAPDVQSTLELVYLRVLGRVKNRAAMESELKALQKTLNQAASQITEILKKADELAGPK
jgi:hypothetical protein